MSSHNLLSMSEAAKLLGSTVEDVRRLCMESRTLPTKHVYPSGFVTPFEFRGLQVYEVNEAGAITDQRSGKRAGNLRFYKADVIQQRAKLAPAEAAFLPFSELSPPVVPLVPVVALVEPDKAGPVPVVPVSDGPAKRRATKPSIEVVALDYMREAYKAGQFQSAAKFHKHLLNTAGVKGSPFELGTGENARKLFCPIASSFFDPGTLSKMWAKIRAA